MQHRRQTTDIPKWSALLVEAVNKPGQHRASDVEPFEPACEKTNVG